MKRIAINGMGRTGRIMLRRLVRAHRWNLDLVAVNDIADPEDIAYLVKYDSVHGRLDETVSYAAGRLKIGDREVALLRESDPAKLPWRALGVDVVIECTGQFTSRAAAAQHLAAGARRVLIGAPAPDADATIVLGVNEGDFDPARHFIVSNASCTTNSLAPPLKVLIDAFGVDEVLATTVHAYTASQGIVDKPAKKKHRGRAAAVSMIPTTTGADSATVQVIPQLKGRHSRDRHTRTDSGRCVNRHQRPIHAQRVGRADQFRDARRGRRRPRRYPRLFRGRVGFRRHTGRAVLGNRPRERNHSRRTPGEGARLVRQRSRLLAPLPGCCRSARLLN